jgi:hypothetical protein
MYVNTKQYYYYFCFYLKINYMLMEWGPHKGNIEEDNIMIYAEVRTWDF